MTLFTSHRTEIQRLCSIQTLKVNRHETFSTFDYVKLAAHQRSAPMSERKYLSVNFIFCASWKDFLKASSLLAP